MGVLVQGEEGCGDVQASVRCRGEGLHGATWGDGWPAYDESEARRQLDCYLAAKEAHAHAVWHRRTPTWTVRRDSPTHQQQQ